MQIGGGSCGWLVILRIVEVGGWGWAYLCFCGKMTVENCHNYREMMFGYQTFTSTYPDNPHMPRYGAFIISRKYFNFQIRIGIKHYYFAKFRCLIVIFFRSGANSSASLWMALSQLKNGCLWGLPSLDSHHEIDLISIRRTPCN